MSLLVLLTVATPIGRVHGQALPSPDELKELSIEELMEVRITSVSRFPERVFGAASAIQLITNERIRRSGATRLPEALRLAPNLQVAQVNSHDWAITSRGFNGAPLSNNSLADKLLVMIDGRSVYTPLFGGVFWDVQNVLLEDIERIEVVSGPGGSLWGANAVNGVINVVTRRARDTQGLYATVAAGTLLRDHVAVRYGGALGERTHFRAHVQRMDYTDTETLVGADLNDRWGLTQGGFRIDFEGRSNTLLTLQGDLYAGEEGSPTMARVRGQNAVVRWSRTFSPQSEVTAQAYVDHTYRRVPGPEFQDQVTTADVDLQHRFPLTPRHRILWGANYRLARNVIENAEPLSFIPADRTLHLFSGFVQDDVHIVPERVTLTAGTKLEHNEYSGFELQPSLRVAWTPPEHTVWAAASRAIRSPSRFDVDVLTPNLVGNEDFASENLLALELGYRVQLVQDAVVSIAGFYNHYDDLRSVNENPAGPPSLRFANDHEATAGGVEVATATQPTPWWRLRGGYTFLEKKVVRRDSTVLPGSDVFEGIDPHHQLLVQSMIDLPAGLEFDLVGRYTDVLPATLLTPRVPPYVDLDLRIGWRYGPVEVEVVGRSLLSPRRHEFGRRATPRNAYAKIRWRL